MSENTQVSEKSVSTDEVVKSVIDRLVGNDENVANEAFAEFVAFGKNERKRVRDAVSARFDRFMRDGNFETAQHVWAVVTRIDPKNMGTSAKSEMTEESVKSVVAEKVALLRYAADALFAGSVPINGWDGISPILDETDIPEITDEMVEKALSVANVSVGTKRKENDIPALIGEYFATQPIRAFRKVSVIRRGIAQMHPDKTIDATWDGRLNAALFGKNGVEGVVPVASGETDDVAEYAEASHIGKAGAYRVEADETDTPDEAPESA